MVVAFLLLSDSSSMNTNRVTFFGNITLLAGMLGWAYFPTFQELFQKWSTEPQYSHGFLVPLFSLYLLYRNRNRAVVDPQPWPILGYAALLMALGFRGLSDAAGIFAAGRPIVHSLPDRRRFDCRRKRPTALDLAKPGVFDLHDSAALSV